MANEALRELELAVDNFKDVIDRLAEIKCISENVKTSADTMQTLQTELAEYSSEIVKAVDKVSSLCDRLLEENRQAAQKVSDELRDTKTTIVDSNESAIDLITKCNDTVIEKTLTSNAQTVKGVAEHVETIRAQVTEYMLSVQKSIDELRLQNTNNSRELRDNISYARETLSGKADGIQTTLNSLVAKNITDRIFIRVGAISAAVAAIASIVGLFI